MDNEYTLHNIEAEQAVLGSIFINNECFYEVNEILLPEYFYAPIHQRIYTYMQVLNSSNATVTPVTLKDKFKSDEVVGDMPILQYMIKLSRDAITCINAKDFAQSVLDNYKKRRLGNIAREAVKDLLEKSDKLTISQQISNLETKLFELNQCKASPGGFQSFLDACGDSIRMTGEAVKRKGKLAGLSTNLKKLDELLGGLQNSDLIVLAGRPGMGKTSLATNIAFSVAKDGYSVGFFSLEMSAEQLATRVLSEQAEISSASLRRGNITEQQMERHIATAKRIGSHPLYIDDTGGLSITTLVARSKRLKRTSGLDLVIVDYLQLLRGSDSKKNDNRVQEVTQITTMLKALAKELNVPIVALSQLSRNVELRPDKRPQLSDLRDSGSIEQDADVVMFVYREEYYLNGEAPSSENKHTPAAIAWEDKMRAAKGKADIIIAKQRHGDSGTVKVAFNSQYTKFSDLIEQ